MRRKQVVVKFYKFDISWIITQWDLGLFKSIFFERNILLYCYDILFFWVQKAAKEESLPLACRKAIEPRTPNISLINWYQRSMHGRQIIVLAGSFNWKTTGAEGPFKGRIRIRRPGTALCTHLWNRPGSRHSAARPTCTDHRWSDRRRRRFHPGRAGGAAAVQSVRSTVHSRWHRRPVVNRMCPPRWHWPTSRRRSADCSQCSWAWWLHPDPVVLAADSPSGDPLRPANPAASWEHGAQRTAGILVNVRHFLPSGGPQSVVSGHIDLDLDRNGVLSGWATL